MRHPPVPALAGICYGRLDAELPATVFEAAADNLHAVLPAWPIASSPSPRCLRLAEALRRRRDGPALHVDERLREMHFGDWEGLEWSALPRDALDAWAADPAGFAPPAGESFNALAARATAALDALPGPHVVITHAGVLRAVLRRAGMPAAGAASAHIAHLQPVWLF